MQHRHLNHENFSLAAIDDVIGRGKRQDWAELRRAALADPAIMEKVLRICLSQGRDPYAQRYRFWRYYAEQHIPTARVGAGSFSAVTSYVGCQPRYTGY